MTAREIITALASETCYCQKAKPKLASFCRVCFKSLPTVVRQSLSQRVGSGYADAYLAAIELLGKKAVTAIEQDAQLRLM